MKVKYTAIVGFLLMSVFSLGVKAQMVKFIKNPLQAKYRVFITSSPKGATHWIYRVAGPTDIRKPGEWYIVTNPQLFKNAMTMFEVKVREKADLIVYYVSKRDSARVIVK
jgi:hypothetical protein